MTGPRELLRCERPVWLLAGATTLLHLLTAGAYGIFRDEMYYVACAKHLDFGYVDHPPLVALVAWLVGHTLGTSVFALRLVPALCAGALVVLGGAMTRRLGGGRYAQLLAGCAIALAPQYVGMLSVYTMNAMDLVFWSALVLVMLHILATGDGRLWLLFGVIAGIGLENKISVVFLCFGVGVGLLMAGRWRYLRDPRLWLGATVAGVLFAPHVIWQIAHGWPTLEFIRRATETKNVAYAPLAFLGEQVKMMNPVTLPLWLAGLVALLAAKPLRPYRACGWAYLAVLILMMTQASKPYYLSPIYPILFAAGAVVTERAAAKGRAWLRPVAVGAVAVSGLLLAPLAKPFLPPDAYVAYASAFGIGPGTDERHEVGRLPQFYADMQGWKEMAEAVARVYRSLPPGDRSKACIFARNYGQAGAMERFGPDLGLPPVISGHNSYWMWGPGSCSGRVVIVIGGDREDYASSFAEVSAGGRFECRDCMPYENHQTLWVARDLQAALADVWPRVKHFN